jgi:hypothetical protein
MTEALRTLLAGLIDYGGLFPPAGLDMAHATRNYAAYRAGPHAWALGRFIVPAARLSELDSQAGEEWRLSVLGVSPRVVEACEIKVERAADAAAILATLPAEVTAYFELPIGEDAAPLAAGPGRAKVRTGGVTPDAFPAPAALARWISRCARARVPFKATAGLHHPLRSVQRCTYQADSPTVLMHGFVNVFLAAALLWQGGSEAAAIATLEEQSPEAFHFDDEYAAWGTHRVTTAQLRAARENFAISFGSCSFEEPIRDLQQLGWL